MAKDTRNTKATVVEKEPVVIVDEAKSETEQPPVVETTTEVLTQPEVTEEAGSTESNAAEQPKEEETTETEQPPVTEVEQPKEEETVTQTQSTPEAVKTLSVSDIDAIVKDNSLRVEEKLALIASNSTPDFSILVSKLLGYEENMNRKAVFKSETVSVGNNFDLLSVLTSVVGTSDFAAFKVKFDIVNLVFQRYSGSAYSAVSLHRFDTAWTFGDARLKTYQMFATVISSLCNKDTRASELKRLDLKLALSKDKTNLSDTAISNIVRYYSN
jgi:hypothetical protein